MDGQDRLTEFLGPSGRAGGPIKKGCPEITRKIRRDQTPCAKLLNIFALYRKRLAYS